MLRDDGDTAREATGAPAIAYEATLQPGDRLIFRDVGFLSDVTPLRGMGDADMFRDAQG